MPITVSTVYTQKRLVRFQHFTAAKRTFSWILIALCNLFIFGSWALISSTASPSDRMDHYLLYILLLDGLLLFLHFGLPYFSVKKSKSLDATLTYVFEENQLQVDAASPLINESMTTQYAAIYRVARSKTELYLYIDRNHGFIVDLSALSQEQLTLLERTLKTALPAKKVRW